MSLPPELRPNRPDVLDEVFEGEAVLVNLRLGRYYALDAVATDVWRALEDGRTTVEVAADVGAGHGLSPEVALAWITPLFRQLADEQLVVVNGALPDAGEPPAELPPLEAQVFTDMEDLLLLDPIHDVNLDETGWPQAPRSATG